MFHNSTTLRHQFRTNSMSFGERRMVYKWTDTLAAGWGKFVGSSKAVGRVISAITLPARLPLKPVKWLLLKSWDAFVAGGIYAQAGAAAAVETGRSLLVDTLGKPLWKLGQTPLVDIKKNLVDNTREIIRGMIRLPINILRTPGAMVQSTRESFSNLFRNTKNLLTFQGDFWNSIKGVSWRHPINSTRNIISSALGGVGEVLMPGAARAHIKACLETPYNVSKNIVTSKTQYFTAIPASVRELRTGIPATMSAPARGWNKGIDWVEKRRKEKAKEDEAAKTVAQREAEKEVKGAAKGAATGKGVSTKKAA